MPAPSSLPRSAQGEIARSNATYFDLLPDPILELIARYVSERPRHQNWETFITPRDLLSLLQTCQSLRTAVTPHCATLTLADIGSTPPTKGVIAGIDADEDATRASALVSAIGASLTELIIDYRRRDARAHAWLAPFAAKCTRVRTLVLRRVPDPPDLRARRATGLRVDVILRAARGRLRSLTLGARVDHACVHAVATHCSDLHVLRLRAHVFIFPVVRALSSSLRELSFHLSPLTTQSARDVRTHCKNLSRIEVFVADKTLSSSLAELFVSYGAQLERVRIVGAPMLPVHMKMVADACNRVQLDVTIPADRTPAQLAHAAELGEPAPDDTPFADAVNAMGARLFTLRWSGARDLRESLPHSLACQNLRCIVLTDLKESAVEVIAALVGTDNGVLEHVDLAFAEPAHRILPPWGIPFDAALHIEEDAMQEADMDDDEAEQVNNTQTRAARMALHILGTNAHAIRVFRFAAMPTDRAAFYEFAKANSDLRDVCVVFLQGARPVSRFDARASRDAMRSDGADVGLHVVQAVDAFARCRYIESLNVTDYAYQGISLERIRFEAVSWACRLMRKRRASVVVCDVDYV